MRTNKKWCVSPTRELHAADTAAIAHALGILEPTAALLYNRGLTTPEAAEKFLCKDEICFHDPFLLDDMTEACTRIEKALENGERIVVYGDYDVDGVTSVSTLLLYLRSRGGDAGYYIPNRSGEGYGINSGALSQLAGEGCRLLITVDTGITAVDEIAQARALGMDVIVTDHHECPVKLPSASAVVNPKRIGSSYPFSELAGVGVVFKLLCALEYRRNQPAEKSSKENGSAENVSAKNASAENVSADWLRALCEDYIDLVALGTIADVMPLIDENRLIVSLGLRIIENTCRPGLAALLELSGVNPPPATGGSTAGIIAKKKRVTSSLIGYVIAPRINAAGRISCASKAVELFLTDSPAEAKNIASALCDTNKERQTEENNIIEQTYKKIEQEHNFERDYVIVIDDNTWHHGVIGIVSSRITEHYNLPSILISFEGSVAEGDRCSGSDVGKGSGRSVKGLNLVEALNSCSDLLVKYGGHELAAGLSIERSKLPEFKRRINEYAAAQLSGSDLATTIDVDCALSTDEITLRQANELYMLEPYGIANPVPTFILRSTRITEIVAIGSGKHTKLIIESGNNNTHTGDKHTAIYFGVTPNELDFYPGDCCDFIFNLNVNDFMGVQTAQLVIRDIDRDGAVKTEYERDRKLYEKIKSRVDDLSSINDRPLSAINCSDLVPARDDFVSVYLYIKHEIRHGFHILSLHRIRRHFTETRPIGAVKLRFIIDILCETGVLGVERVCDNAKSAPPRQTSRQSAAQLAVQPAVQNIELITARGEELYRFKINNLAEKVNLEKSAIFKRLKALK